MPFILIFKINSFQIFLTKSLSSDATLGFDTLIFYRPFSKAIRKSMYTVLEDSVNTISKTMNIIHLSST